LRNKFLLTFSVSVVVWLGISLIFNPLESLPLGMFLTLLFSTIGGVFSLFIPSKNKWIVVISGLGFVFISLLIWAYSGHDITINT